MLCVARETCLIGINDVCYGMIIRVCTSMHQCTPTTTFNVMRQGLTLYQ